MTTTERSVEEIKQPRICTRTGIHTCRLNSIHVNERDKIVLEEYLQAKDAEWADMMQEELKDAYISGFSAAEAEAEKKREEAVEYGRVSVLEDFDSLMKADGFMGLTDDEWRAVQKFFRYNDEKSGWKLTQPNNK